MWWEVTEISEDDVVDAVAGGVTGEDQGKYVLVAFGGKANLWDKEGDTSEL